MTRKRQSLDEICRDALPEAPAIGEQVIWDDAVTGLGLRLRAGSPATWIYRRKIKGRMVKRTLARKDALTIDQARDAARMVAVTKLSGCRRVSLRDFAKTFMRECKGRWKPLTIEGHRHNLSAHILPALGNLTVDAISHADVTAWLDGLTVAGRSKDRLTSVLSSMMRHAEAQGLRPPGSNPCAGRRRHRSDFEARYLGSAEFRRLGLALDRATAADPVEVACIHFLMLTGARRGEALALEWSMTHGNRAILPDSKTGPKCLWFPTPVRQLLSKLERTRTSPRVFVHPSGRGIACSLDRVWREVREQAGLGRLRLHDLRHSYASVAVGSGEELHTVTVLLGHSQAVTTQGYAHLADRPLAVAARRIDNHLADALTPSEPVEPIRPASWTPKAPPKPKGPSPAFLEAKARMAAFHARFEPPLPIETVKPAKPKRKPKPRSRPNKPKSKKRQSIEEREDRRWSPHIERWRKTRLGLPAFCAKEGLDVAAMRKALARHFGRAKETHGEQHP